MDLVSEQNSNSMCHLLIWAIIIIIIVALIYWGFKVRKQSSKETFTAINGLDSPMRTYDDYGTFDFIHHTNDLPRYDRTYYNELCNYSDAEKDSFDKQNERIPGVWPINENFNKDSFIKFQGNLLRRELVPSNYYQNNDFAPINETKPELIDENNALVYAPQGYNIYFD